MGTTDFCHPGQEKKPILEEEEEETKEPPTLPPNGRGNFKVLGWGVKPKAPSSDFVYRKA